MKSIRKAIIPAAGLGTRFLPATKNIPKEMLPIVDRPALLYNVEEAVRAGIEDIVIIAGRGKNAIEDFFDRSVELEEVLKKSGRMDLYETLVKIRDMANFISIRQKEALGLGHAVLVGRPIVGDEPFAVLLGDEIMLGTPGVTHDLKTTYESTGQSAVAVMKVPKSDVVKYGMVKFDDHLNESTGFPARVLDVIEKPSVEQAPSQWALPGRYVFTRGIFDALAETKPGKGGEIQLTDGMRMLAKKEGILAQPFKDQRFDTGDKFGYLTANIELSLVHPDLADDMKAYIKQLAQRL
ncbi:MAG: UTP--glucose-1-phosphate uridylyltransferase GalU [Bdellovibrionales bacterium]